MSNYQKNFLLFNIIHQFFPSRSLLSLFYLFPFHDPSLATAVSTQQNFIIISTLARVTHWRKRFILAPKTIEKLFHSITHKPSPWRMLHNLLASLFTLPIFPHLRILPSGFLLRCRKREIYFVNITQANTTSRFFPSNLPKKNFLNVNVAYSYPLLSFF